MRHINGRSRLGSGVNPPQAFQLVIIEALDADGKTVNPCLAVIPEAYCLGSAGVGLQGDFSFRTDTKP